VVKKVVKKKLTAKEKRERGVTIHFLPFGVFLVLTWETVGDREGGQLASSRIPRIRPCKQIPLPFLDRFHFSSATQTLRTQIETVIGALMDNPEKAYKGERSSQLAFLNLDDGNPQRPILYAYQN